MKMGFALLGACVLLGIPGAQAAGQAHRHGTVQLNVAVDGQEIAIGVEMPLDSLLGFERAPRTAAEKQQAAAALARMRDAGALFGFDARAGCVPSRAQVDAAVLEHDGQHRHDGGHRHDGEHADLEASYVFRCAQPAHATALEVRLFEAFRRIERIEVQAALPQGQRKTVLRRPAKHVRLVE